MQIPCGRWIGLGIVLAGVSCAVPESGGGSEGRSVEEVIAEIQEAEREGRYGDVLELVPPEDRAVWVFAAWFGAAYEALGDEDATVDYQAIVTRFDLDEEWLSDGVYGREAANEKANQALEGVALDELFGACVGFSAKHGKFGVPLGFQQDVGDVEVEGDRARATVGSSEYSFVRVGADWYWDVLPEEEGAAR